MTKPIWCETHDRWEHAFTRANDDPPPTEKYDPVRDAALILFSIALALGGFVVYLFIELGKRQP